MSSSSDFHLWDIWLARVAFEDEPQKSKLRPVMVVAEDSCVVLSVKITSHPPREGYEGEYEIIRWREAGLLKPSTIRLSKRMSLPLGAFIKRLGTLHYEDQSNIIDLI